MKKLIGAILVAGVVISGCQEKKEEGKTSSESSITQTITDTATAVKDKAQETVQKATDTAQEAAGQAVQKVEETARSASEKTQEAVNKVEEKAKEVAEKTTEAASAAGEKVAQKAKEVTGSSSIDGKQLFAAKGCAGCHQATVDTVGPSLKKIAAAYKGKEEDLIKFLKGEGKPHVDPAKFGIMQPQLNTTKAMSDDELKALSDFILSH